MIVLSNRAKEAIEMVVNQCSPEEIADDLNDMYQAYLGREEGLDSFDLRNKHFLVTNLIKLVIELDKEKVSVLKIVS